VHLDPVLIFSLSCPEGAEGRGEEANGFSGSNTLPSPRLDGEGE